MRKQCRIIYPFSCKLSKLGTLKGDDQTATFTTVDFLFPTVSICKSKFFYLAAVVRSTLERRLVLISNP